MVAGIPIALFMLAQTAATSQPPSTEAKQSVAPVPAVDAAKAAAKGDSCPQPSSDSRTIVICSQRPQGYRLNPDVMEARREVRNGGRPIRPGGTIIPDCAHVGPAPCVSAGIPLIGAALTAVEMAKRAAEGKAVGPMFVTDPHPTEYQLYQMAKARREAEEEDRAAAEAAARTKADAEKDIGGAAATTQAQPSGN